MRFILLFFVLSGHAGAFSLDHGTALPENIIDSTDSGKKIAYYMELSRRFQYDNPDSAIFFTRQGLDISRKAGDRLGEAMLIGQLGTLNEKHDNLTMAKKYMLESLAIYQQLRHDAGIAAQYNGLGIIEGKSGNYQAATRYFITALRLNEKTSNTVGIVQSYIKLGVVNERSGDLDKALEYYFKARDLNGGEPAPLYTLLNNIGIVEAKKGNLKTALNYFQQGAALSDSSAYAPMHLNLAMNAANALKELGQEQKALGMFHTVLEKSRKYHLPEIEARTLINLSGIDKPNGNRYLSRALEIARKTGQKELSSEVYLAMSELHKKTGNYQEALSALDQHYKLKDSIFNLNKSREISTLQASYDLDKSKERVQNLELANAKRTAERNGGMVVIALILLLCGGLWYYLRKVQRLNLKLQESNSVKDKLFSIIGHDLRSPMGSIIQMVDLMESGLLNEQESREMLQALRNHSQVSLETLDSLLLWGKGQLQGLVVRKSGFESKQVIQKNVAFFQRQAEQKMITILDETPADLRLFADRDHIDFVLRNLMSNALKFSFPSGRIRVRSDLSRFPGFAVYSVKDEGKGIRKELLNQLFHPMMDSGSGTAGEKGTGLGLMLCKEFLAANGGDIWVHSTEGHGAEFFFSVPVPAIRMRLPEEQPSAADSL
ncbi:MAG TPA: tetratricopeptide repeat protein [Sphingobacteriaceae bacterium]